MTKTGWICPKCGSVYAPWMFECRKCNKPVVRINHPEPSPTEPQYGPLGPSDLPRGTEVTCNLEGQVFIVEESNR